MIRIVTYASVVALAAFSTMPASAQQRDAAPEHVEAITVRLSNFAFTPDHLRLKVGIPVRLKLVNESGGKHDFSAPKFFAASEILPGSFLFSNGEIDLRSHQTVELTVVPHVPGTYRLECTHFLHSFFGMHGKIDVVP